MQLVVVCVQISHAIGYGTEASTATGLHPCEHSVLGNTGGKQAHSEKLKYEKTSNVRKTRFTKFAGEQQTGSRISLPKPHVTLNVSFSNVLNCGVRYHSGSHMECPIELRTFQSRLHGFEPHTSAVRVAPVACSRAAVPASRVVNQAREMKRMCRVNSLCRIFEYQNSSFLPLNSQL